MLRIAILLFAVQAIYHAALRLGWWRATRAAPATGPAVPATRPAPPSPPPILPLSVIVAARDEAKSIEGLLDALSAQEYPHFEVVVIDDGSTDATADLVRARSEQDVRFRVLPNPDPRDPRKKHALIVGIAAARHDRLVFTDADTRPEPGWLGGMARIFAAASGPVLVVGIGLPMKRPGWLNSLQRWDAMLGAYTAGGAIGWNRAWLAKGSNMAYDRALFEEVGGFGSGMAAMSGDDDLMVQSVVRRRAGRVVFLAEGGTFVPSPSPDTWAGWLRQKIRHTSASRHYGLAVQVHLALYHGSATLLWLAPLVAGLPGLGVLAARLLVMATAAEGPLRRLGGQDLISRAPVLDLLHAVFHALVPPIGFFRGARRW